MVGAWPHVLSRVPPSAQARPQRLCQGCRGRGPPGRILRQTLQTNPLQVEWNVRGDVAERRWSFGEDLFTQPPERRLVEGEQLGEELVEHDAQAVDVRARADLP